MKIKVSIAVFICIFILTGCQSKGKATVNVSKASSITKAASVSQSKNNSYVNEGGDKKSSTQQAKSGAILNLTENQKQQVNSKLNSAINNINSSLKSLEDFKDIDLSTIN